MATLDELVQSRGTIKGQLTRFINFVKKHNINSLNLKIVTEIKCRQRKVEDLWQNFDNIQTKIEMQDKTSVQEDERELFETSYFEIISEASALINQFDSLNISQSTQNLCSQSVGQSNVAMQLNVKLPTIDLPTFDGSYENWHNFRDIFNTLVHSNATIDSIQKFYYLRMYLSKQASQVIESLEVTCENYDIAWDLLNKRYENKRLTVHSHVQALFSLPIIAKESYKSLRELVDKLQKHLRALNNLEQPTHNWDTLIIYLVSGKLDPISKREWEKSIARNTNLPTYTEFIDFLSQRCQLLETLNPPQNNQINKSKITSLATYSKTEVCLFCNKSNHKIYKCETFLKLSPEERSKNARQLRLCLNCLRNNHIISDCKSTSVCQKCHKKHHSLLHFNTNYQKGDIKQNETDIDKNQTETYVGGHSLTQTQSNNILLSTACVYVSDYFGNQHLCRVLLDSGSQANFITKVLQSKLQLATTKVNSIITGVNQATSNICHKTQVEIQAHNNSYTTVLQCLVVNKITENMPHQSFSVTNLNIPENINLADQNFNKESQIDMLLGASIFWELLCVGKISLGENKPILYSTKLGWIISGPLPEDVFNSSSNKTHCGVVNTMENNLEKFWDIQEFSESKILDKEEQYCETNFINTTQRTESGRFVVNIPIKENSNKLGNTREIALKRFRLLEKRLEQNPELKKDYSEFLNEYLTLGHMKLINEKNDSENLVTFYLPHHAVFKGSSTTTKTRVVFDASCKSDNNISLNDIQCVGPVVQNDLFNILIRFRKHKYVLTGDIEKMYRQILVTEKDCHLQRIFWRQNPSDEIQCFELQTVTYGTASAPYLATRCLKQLSVEFEATYPAMCDIIAKDFYVDDMLTGANSIEELHKIKSDVSLILSSAGFNLRKWLSNTLLNNIPETNSQNFNYAFDENSEIKMLGVYWNAISDSFTYAIKDSNKDQLTKRTILSCVAQIFDPLGLLNPITIIAKLIIQQLWQHKLSWDETIPNELKTKWSQFFYDLKLLNNLEIPRCVLASNPVEVNLHGFADASEHAFGACIYIQSRTYESSYQTHLLCAKSRVAPLKQLTLPRLELCAAALLSKLMHKIINSIDINFSSYFYWTDSKITLCWIKSSCQRWHTFVANRVATIQKTSDIAHWYHVKSEDNPADLISRGVRSAQVLNSSSIWWIGPKWLTQDRSNWPLDYSELEFNENTVPEARIQKTALATTACNELNLFTRYSSLIKLIRTTAWILRFSYNAMALSRNLSRKVDEHLTVQELDHALLKLIKIAQHQCYQKDIADLQKSNTLNSKSTLLALNPFLDKDIILRVGGRIHLSSLPYEKIHPIILPKNNLLTTLIIKSEHYKNLHCGTQTLLSIIRDRFWPISGTTQIKRILRDCIVCFRVKPKTESYKMGNLPSLRLKPTPPFYNCGVDYAGPFLLKDKRTRGCKSLKCYICLFICLTTKALHLELVTSLTSEAFLACLKRFIARRGKPKNIMSDNATNFAGANNALKEFSNFLNDKAVQNIIINNLANEGIAWSFIPPRSPHFGGLWEAGVKSVKSHLKRVIGNVSLVFEDFYTVLTQIEAMLNSRPLHPLSSDPSDLYPLTPAHFLIGQPLTALPERDVTRLNENRLSLYQRMQQLVQQFWARWSKEYITELQVRTKWKRDQPTKLKEGALVLIKEENQPPLKWNLGRITNLIPGSDGITRVVDIRTSSGTIRRSVTKVCVLPNADQSQSCDGDV